MRLAIGVFVVLALAACGKSTPRGPEVDVEVEAGTGTGVRAPAADAAQPVVEVRYLALGDSFTAGTGSSMAESFPTRLAERWRAHDRRVTLKNVAVNGYTTDDVTARELPEVQPFHPTIVTLAIGANDRVRGSNAETYRTHVRAILRSILDAGVEATSIVTLPQPEWSLSPAASSFGTPAELSADIVTFNTAFREETEKVGARYVDLYPLMHHQAELKMLAPDGLHPSAAAHDEWAAKLFETLP